MAENKLRVGIYAPALGLELAVADLDERTAVVVAEAPEIGREEIGVAADALAGAELEISLPGVFTPQPDHARPGKRHAPFGMVAAGVDGFGVRALTRVRARHVRPFDPLPNALRAARNPVGLAASGAAAEIGVFGSSLGVHSKAVDGIRLQFRRGDDHGDMAGRIPCQRDRGDHRRRKKRNHLAGLVLSEKHHQAGEITIHFQERVRRLAVPSRIVGNRLRS